MIARYYKGNGPSREKLRELLQTILYDSSFLTEEIFEERYQASIDPETVELFGKRTRQLWWRFRGRGLLSRLDRNAFLILERAKPP